MQSKLLTVLAMSASLIATNAYAAQRKEGQKPEPGVVATVTVGAPLLERYNMLVDPGVRVGGNVDLDLGMQGVIRISAGTLMTVESVSGTKLKACTTTDAYTNMMGQTGPACLTDRDGDGQFDTGSAKLIGLTTRRLSTPVPYARADVPETFGQNNQKNELVYLGAAGGVLRLSYREFSNDMARPSATEELTFPVSGTYPQTVTWRDTKITLLGLGDDGLRYRVEETK